MRPRWKASRSFALLPSLASPVLFVRLANLTFQFSSDSLGRFLPAKEAVRDEEAPKGSRETIEEEGDVCMGGGFAFGKGCRGGFDI